MVKTLCIVQARLTSSRLPNKILLELGDSHMTILEHVKARLSKSKYIDQVVFAIPESSSNDKLADFLDQKRIAYYRGSEDDVLDRFYKCAIQYHPQFVVRATCDNPLVDWVIGDRMIELINNYDYIGCKNAPLGSGVEVFTMKALTQAYHNATGGPQHEHVTPYMYQNMRTYVFDCKGVDYRLTVDEDKDLYVVNEIYKELYKGYPIPNTDVYSYLAEHSDLASYNKEVHQKKLGE